MVCKRPFVDEDSFWLGYKHPRHMDCYNEFASLVEFAPCNDVPKEPHTSGELSIKSQGEERHASNRISEHPVGGYKEFVIGAPCSFSSSYVTGHFNGKDSKSEAAVLVTRFPDFEADDLTKSLDHPEEIYSSFSDFAPRKLVSVGPDHQVDVPVWDAKGINNSPGRVNASDPHVAFLKCAGSDLAAHDDTSEQLMMGFCVIPMPDSDMLAYDADDVGRSRADCSCPDEGSMRCVRQHIMEAREKLRDTFGQETFIELGFYEMGEVVARKWSKEEEQVFHEVIFTNSSSSGKNFWDHLSVFFPSRTKKEIVSYYFNVFMLRKRAEQNRLDPLNIDSDNDEWEGSDAGDEEDEDSVIESPQVDHTYNHGHREHIREDDESGDESCGNDDDGDAGEDDLSDSHVGKFHGDCGFDPGVQFACEKNSENGVEDNSLQDESCMSYDSQLNRAEDSSGPVDVRKTAQEKSRVENDHGEYLQCSGYDELSSGVEHGHVLGPYDVKVWDFGCLGGLKKDADFLPTFNMIEEVFGEEAWLNKGSDRN